jgi:hypothetical protein
MDEENITVKVMPFEPYPEGRILATLEALERPIVISVAEHLPEWKRAQLVVELKAYWRTMLAIKENDLIQINVIDPRSVTDLEPG